MNGQHHSDTRGRRLLARRLRTLSKGVYANPTLGITFYDGYACGLYESGAIDHFTLNQGGRILAAIARRSRPK